MPVPDFQRLMLPVLRAWRVGRAPPSVTPVEGSMHPTRSARLPAPRLRPSRSNGDPAPAKCHPFTSMGWRHRADMRPMLSGRIAYRLN